MLTVNSEPSSTENNSNSSSGSGGAVTAFQETTSDPNGDVESRDRSEHDEQIDQPPARNSRRVRFGRHRDADIDEKNRYCDHN